MGAFGFTIVVSVLNIWHDRITWPSIVPPPIGNGHPFVVFGAALSDSSQLSEPAYTVVSRCRFHPRSVKYRSCAKNQIPISSVGLG
jgi:hypothetical protein